ncbi:MAG: hypothetical protein AAGC54_09005 [Cyanobacteria bacterium P01_F01_bin.4]
MVTILPIFTSKVALANDLPEGGYRGFYTFGEEVEIFQPCDANQPLWVTGDEATLQPLRAEYSEAATRPYESVFVELVGQPGERIITAGPPAYYDGHFRVDQVLRIVPEQVSCFEPSPHTLNQQQKQFGE